MKMNSVNSAGTFPDAFNSFSVNYRRTSRFQPRKFLPHECSRSNPCFSWTVSRKDDTGPCFSYWWIGDSCWHRSKSTSIKCQRIKLAQHEGLWGMQGWWVCP